MTDSNVPRRVEARCLLQRSEVRGMRLLLLLRSVCTVKDQGGEEAGQTSYKGVNNGKCESDY